MTRGTCVMFYEHDGEERIMQSIEFNGDMYPSGYGMLALKSLAALAAVDKDICEYFENIVNYIDKEGGYKYSEREEQMTYDSPRMMVDESAKEDNNIIDGYVLESDTYFKTYFSDYLYIINKTGKKIHMKMHGNSNGSAADTLIDVYLENNELLVTHYYHFLFKAFVSKKTVGESYIYKENGKKAIFIGVPIPNQEQVVTIPKYAAKTWDGPPLDVTTIGSYALSFLKCSKIICEHIEEIEPDIGTSDVSVKDIILSEKTIKKIAPDSIPATTSIIYT